MTRINTNLSSLQAQNSLQTSQNEMQTAMTRLSTGLRINSGADDPSGMIASTELQSNITSINSAVSNSQLAEQMIATADSGLGQISSLLNSIQGLVTSAANTGTLSSDQISADQLQVDSSLSAINQIAQSTSFQGQNLLNGSLGFNVAKSASASNISSLQINQADLTNAGDGMAVNVNVKTAATQAQLVDNAIPATVATGNGSAATIGFADGSGLTITAAAHGVANNGVKIAFNVGGNVPPTASFSQATNTLTINVATGKTSSAAIASVIGTDTNGLFTGAATATVGSFNSAVDSPTDVAATSATATVNTSNGGQLTVTSLTPGSAGTTSVSISSKSPGLGRPRRRRASTPRAAEMA